MIPVIAVAQWVEEEFCGLDLGDKRRNERLKKCVTQAAGMGESNPDRAKSKRDLKATYRLVNRPEVIMDKIFAPHNQSARHRCSQYRRVYLVQDTTQIDLTKPRQQVRGAGPLGTSSKRGFFYHPLFALSEEGIPLGVVEQLVWTRSPEALNIPSKARAVARKQACFEEKESFRWLEMLQFGEQLARSQPQTDFVMVADSEADIGELFREVSEFPENYSFIIRQSQPRGIVAAIDSATGQPLEASNIEEALSQAQWRGERTVSVGGRDAPHRPHDQKRVRQQARVARTTVLKIRCVFATLAGPRRRGGGELEDSPVCIVEALEESPPAGELSIRWVLLTTLPGVSFSDLEAILDGYCQRWGVELYFKTLKSGLKLEDMKYETLDRYLAAFAILCVVGWRVEYLKGAARHDPEGSCEKYFTREEWMAIVHFVTRRAAEPSHPPPMREFVTLIAQLGGYLAKKSQGPPGSTTLWRGMSQFETIVQAYSIFHKQRCGV